MLMDSELLKVSAKADAGDPVAQNQMAQAFHDGEGAPEDLKVVKKYAIMLAEQGDKVVDEIISYEHLIITIGDIEDQLGNKHQAYKWWKKADEYLDRIVDESYSKEVRDDADLLEKILKTKMELFTKS